MKDDDLVIHVKDENIINLPMSMLNQIGKKLTSEPELVKSLHEYANTVARTTGDFSQSAEVRKVLENNETSPDRFNAILNAAKMKLIHAVFSEIANHAIVSAKGLFAQAMGAPKFEPAFMLPDNLFGQYLFQQLKEMYEGMGVSKPGDIKPIHVDVKKGQS